MLFASIQTLTQKMLEAFTMLCVLASPTNHCVMHTGYPSYVANAAVCSGCYVDMVAPLSLFPYGPCAACLSSYCAHTRTHMQCHSFTGPMSSSQEHLCFNLL